MKSLLYNRYNPFPLMLPLKTAINLTGERLILVVYHLVCDEIPDHIRHLYLPRSLKTFSDDMTCLMRYYEPVDLLSLKDMVINHEKPKKNLFFISFDDGLEEFFSMAAPVLTKMGIPATCFLNTAFIDNNDMFYRYKVSVLIETIQKHKENPQFWKSFHKLKEDFNIPPGYYRHVLLDLGHTHIPFIHAAAKLVDLDFSDYLKKKQPYLTSEKIRELIGKGFTFGGHGIDHTEFSTLDDEGKIKQAIQSTREVSKRFDLSYRVFAFPFTDFGIRKSFFDAIYDRDQVELSFGTAGLKHDSEYRNLQRIPIEDFNLSAERRLKTDYFYYLLKGIVGKNTIRR
ncbi:MAG: polysaccharide deacetylase family protein [Bacteroidales bacterium]|nr:polysaccharide deacetylase family protein [Bacteroidales bacterium]